jgi:hypothetical protein
MAENETADLELSIHRYDENAYSVDFRFTDSDPANQADVGLGAGEQALAVFDFSRLTQCQGQQDMQAYGQELSRALFADEHLRVAFSQARARARSLRLRLAIHSSAIELHRLRWETLTDPQTGQTLVNDQGVFFSRYLSSLDWRPVHLGSKSDLRILAVIANPTGLENYSLAPIQHERELEVIRKGAGDIPIDEVECASLNQIVLALTKRNYDVLYLVAHGRFNRANSEPALWLEDDQGGVARVAGSEFVQRLRELDQRPSLVILVSCQSAGAGEGDVLAALGPALAEVGIPAVLAMQDNISMDTVSQLMPVLFEQLRIDGRIDRALCVARGQVRTRPDWWMPALFMRLRSARSWYIPEFGGPRGEFGKWPSLLRGIQTGRCTPILGPGINDALVGPIRDLTRRWAEQLNYPLAAHERESLTQVAQFRSVDQDRATAEEDWMDLLRSALRKRAAAVAGFTFPAALQSAIAPVGEMLQDLGTRLRQDDKGEPHKVLAELPVKVFITANTDELLEEALREASKDPVTMLCPWREFSETTDPAIYSRSDAYEPTPEHPLVYHLFGLLSQPESLVLTEDDTFEFLIGITRHKKNIPDQVGRALTDSALLFLGFQTEDWSFRVLLHALLAKEGNKLLRRHAHIAAQIEPEEGRLIDPDRARRYLEAYFAHAAEIEISIYWGSAREFMREMMTQLSKVNG